MKLSTTLVLLPAFLAVPTTGWGQAGPWVEQTISPLADGALSASYLDNTIAWYENTAGDGSVWSGHTISTVADGARAVFAVDLDGDGDVDVLSASWSVGIAWHENTAGDGTAWSEHLIHPTFRASTVFAEDVDGDGDADIVGPSGGGGIAWYENTHGSGWVQHVTSTSADGAGSVFAADLDGDGDVDVLSASWNDDTIAWYENTASGSSEGHSISTAADGARSVFAADVDGDGDSDVLSASEFDDTIAWYEDTVGDGSAWTDRTITTAADGARSVFVADVDGEGDADADALSASWRDDTVAWHENAAGDGSTWVAHAVSVGIDGARTVFAADVDGDGDVDALSTASGRQMGWPRREYGATWHENTAGDGSAWTEHVIIPPGHSASSVFAGDVDGDGDLDALFAAAFQGVEKIVWYENTVGDGSVWSEHPNPVVIASARSIFAGDLDGDGAFEVLSASRDDDRIVWYDVAVEALEMLRLGTPPNPLAFLPGVTSGPVIGAPWDPVLDHSGFQPGAVVDFMAISPTILNLPTPLGTLLCAVPPPGLGFTGPPSVPFSVPIPLDGSLVGHTLCSQGGSVTAAGAIRLANAIDIRIGTF